MPKEWAALTVNKQSADPDSTLSFFRRALELRKRRVEFDGDDVDWLDASGDAVIFRRPGGLVCALNCGAQPVPCRRGTRPGQRAAARRETPRTPRPGWRSRFGPDGPSPGGRFAAYCSICGA